MTDRQGAKWYTVREIASGVERSVKTVRRALRPYRGQCRLTRDQKHPRKVLVMPEVVAKSLLEMFQS